MYTSSVYFQCFILFLEKWVKFDNKKFACVLYVLCVENWNDIAYILMNHSISKNYCMCQNLIISIGILSYVIITRQPGSITAFFIRKRHHVGICQGLATMKYTGSVKLDYLQEPNSRDKSKTNDFSSQKL